ncbi:hypothetical protein QN277_011021 [Acacia crassicarpa]|nr:hypothetical protein QN277_011021 [Acacia crassicarpa]
MRKSQNNQKGRKEEGSSHVRTEKMMGNREGVVQNRAEEGNKKLERQSSTEDINASAEAFIKNFRQHLLIQRLQSLENYEQMLARGL